MNKITYRYLLVAASIISVTAAQAQTKANLVLHNAKIYTQNLDKPWAEAVAVKDGKIIYVGNNKGALAFVDSNTDMQDLSGEMLMPGLNDAHVHPTTGAVKALFECNFSFSASPDDISLAVKACVENSGDTLWVRGGQWSSDFFVNHPMEEPRKFLDKISTKKAIVLVDDAYHNAWFNTKALKVLGLLTKNATITGGQLEKSSLDGLPNGMAIEAFGFLKENLKWNRAQYQQAASYAIGQANKHGITGIKGTAMTAVELQGYQDHAEKNGPSIHMAAAIMTPYGHRQEPLDIGVLEDVKKRYQGSYVDASFVKIFMDGVPTAARTAAMLAPYLPATPGDEHNRGTVHVDPELLKKDVIALDKAGFTVKIHTAGDRSVRIALDAIEAARKANGRSGLRHELAHAGYISDADLPRFKQLNTVADLCPFLWSPSPIIESIISAVGEPRASQYWPIKSLVESGTAVLAGSDWPATAATINPWPGIESMVSRQDPSGQFAGTLWPEQAITLPQALHIFTMDSAKSLKKGALTGSIELGKSADFILLNHNLFDVPLTQVSETKVLKTWFSGRLVYAAK